MSSKQGSPPKKKGAGKEGQKKEGKKKEGAKGTAGGDEARAQQVQQLSAELALAQGRLAALSLEQQAREAELRELRTKVADDEATYGDVLRHQQLEQDGMHQQARALELRLEAAQKQISGLTAELQATQEAARHRQEDEAGASSAACKRMLSAANHKDEAIQQQEAELAQLRARLQQAHDSLYQAHETIETLRYKAGGSAQLLFLFDDPCLAKIERQRLTGKLPLLQPGQALCCAGGRWVLQYGSVPAAGGGVEAVVQALDLLSGQWQAPVVEPCEGPLSGHAVVAAKNKLVTFGGSCGANLLSALRVFSPDAMAWVPAPQQAHAPPLAPAPCPRAGHAMVYCAAGNCVYLFGGAGEGRRLLGDLWRLQMDTFQWEQLECLPGTRGAAAAAGGKAAQEEGLPRPCYNAALAVSEDGERLWLSGGSAQGGRCQGTLWCYELQSHTWSLVQPNLDSAYFEPREQHTMAAVRRWLLVAGGCCRQSTGEQKQLADTMAFDTLTNAWDRLNNDAWAVPELPGCTPGSGGPCLTTTSSSTTTSSGGGAQAQAASATRAGSCNGPTTSRRGSIARAPSGDKGSSRAPPQLGAGSCAFMGGRLLMLKQTPAGTLGELRTVALSLLDEVVRKRAQKRASLIVIERLELMECAATPTSLEVAWVAPTKNAHKLRGFKLMMTDRDGGAKEVYEGTERSCTITGLAPGTEYILACKAIYDDASFVWSESQAFKTLGKSKT